MSKGDHKSKCMSMTCGVPQGSILALVQPVYAIIRKNQMDYHSYADETQMYWRGIAIISELRGTEM